VTRVLRAGLAYFACVFGAGFLLALVRIPFLVPRVGVRTAELLEAPVMLLVILVASRWLVRRNPDLGRTARMLAGLFALVLLVLAELALAWTRGLHSLHDIVAARDPLAGSVYLGALLVFAIAPACWPTAMKPAHAH
jgi:hypothetical protein